MDKKIFCKDNALKIFGVAAFALTFICAVLSTLSRTVFFDEIGYYQADAIIPQIFIGVCACSALLAVIFCFIPKLRIEPAAQSFPLPVRMGALALAFGFAIMTAKSLETLSIILEDSVIVWDLKTFCTLIFPIAIRVIAMVHFLLVGINKSSAGAFAVIGNACFILFAVLEIGNVYFNSQIPMNSPTATLMYLAFLFAMLLFANEARIGLGDDKAAYHAFCAAMTTLFGASFCVSEAFAHFDLINDPTALASTLTLNSYFPIIFFISVFAATRLAAICFDTPCDEVAEQENEEPEGDGQNNDQADAPDDAVDTQEKETE